MTERRETDVSTQRYVYLVPEQSDRIEDVTDFGLQKLWEVSWERRGLVALFVLICTMAGATYAFLATPWYKADVVLSPVNDRSLPSSLSALASVDDLASLAGLALPSAGGSAPLAVLKSKSFVREFIEDQNLMPVLFSDKWDPQRGVWRVKGTDQPDIRDAVKYFDEKVRVVTEDKKAGLVTLSIEWKDPSVAARWANLLVQRLNDRVRSEAIREAETSIGYLQKEMLATTVISLQNSIGRVLEGEMQKMALARAKKEFAFKVVDEAYPPKRRAYPQRTLVVLTSALLGAMLGMFYAVASQFWRQPKVS